MDPLYILEKHLLEGDYPTIRADVSQVITSLQVF
jgi:hypothetical protein